MRAEAKLGALIALITAILLKEFGVLFFVLVDWGTQVF